MYVEISHNVTYFDSCGVEYIRKENITSNTFRTQEYDSIMCQCFYIGFIDFILKGKNLSDYTNLFFRNEHEKNEKVILKYFQ